MGGDLEPYFLGMMTMEHQYYEFAALLFISTLVGVLAVRLKQPLLVGFILVGILVGPAGLDLIGMEQQVSLLAEIGVTILLFVVGLKLDMHLVRNLGPVALATGLGQLTFTIVLGYVIGLMLGFDSIKALYVAVALTFSSTIIIVKLLSDKKEIDSLHGRIAMGFLIVQDIAVVLAMMVVGSLSVSKGLDVESTGLLLLSIIGKLLTAALLVVLAMRYLLPSLMHLLAKSPELMLLFCIAWGTSAAALGDYVGFSKEVGAFLAGFSLASTPYREAVSARLTSVRDFLLLFFFVHLGSQLQFAALGEELSAALVFSLFVLIGNPLVVIVIMGAMGYRRRTGFLAGLTVAQISEFSIIFMAMGITLGHINDNALGLITLVGIVTITISTYMILYSHKLYEWLSPWLTHFERRNPYREAEEAGASIGNTQVLVFGLGRYGGRLVHRLRDAGVAVLGLDFDPEVVREYQRQGLNVAYGDIESHEFIEHLPLDSIQWVISTVPDLGLNRGLGLALTERGYGGRLAVTVHHERDGQVLEEAGVGQVLRPYQDAADYAAELVCAQLSSLQTEELERD
ncbi:MULTISPECIES: cation:proton antiporter [Alloalcanivorax]|uniref:Cation:proton antiporter n=2 Tax=Alloalcanivorax TaxID=3020832 RepID=A0A9Q3ZI68_9GAMM|nr:MULTISPECIES: cation:proton antiporter family protein [Alloalcanivorax]MCE7510557.1 cation:proton antiporter [Alloalcanivorax xenomutans]MCU5781490.1 sodium/proton antiporter [Alloalcanivorax balearicus MACL04]